MASLPSAYNRGTSTTLLPNAPSLGQAQEHAHELYRSPPRWCLDWRYRGGRLLAEVAHWRPDIGCLQEVDQLPTFQSQLVALG